MKGKINNEKSQLKLVHFFFKDQTRVFKKSFLYFILFFEGKKPFLYIYIV